MKRNKICTQWYWAVRELQTYVSKIFEMAQGIDVLMFWTDQSLVLGFCNGLLVLCRVSRETGDEPRRESKDRVWQCSIRLKWRQLSVHCALLWFFIVRIRFSGYNSSARTLAGDVLAAVERAVRLGKASGKPRAPNIPKSVQSRKREQIRMTRTSNKLLLSLTLWVSVADDLSKLTTIRFFATGHQTFRRDSPVPSWNPVHARGRGAMKRRS